MYKEHGEKTIFNHDILYYKKIEILFLLFVEVIANNTGFTMSYNPAKRTAESVTERGQRAAKRAKTDKRPATERGKRAAKRAKADKRPATERGQRAAKRALIVHRMYLKTHVGFFDEIFMRAQKRDNLSKIALKEARAKYLDAFVAFEIARNNATIKHSVVRAAHDVFCISPNDEATNRSAVDEADAAFTVAYTTQLALYEALTLAKDARVLASNVSNRDSMAMSLASEKFTKANDKYLKALAK
jgi:hypothetical protein